MVASKGSEACEQHCHQVSYFKIKEEQNHVNSEHRSIMERRKETLTVCFLRSKTDHCFVLVSAETLC